MTDAISKLIETSADQKDSGDAQRFAQAALNAAHAQSILRDLEAKQIAGLSSEEAAWRFLEQANITLYSDKRIDLGTATEDLSWQHEKAIGYLCAQHGWTVNPPSK